MSRRCFQGECRLQMEAQRISLSQIHAAQLELLQEQTEARTHSLELRLQQKSSQGDPGEALFFNNWVCELHMLNHDKFPPPPTSFFFSRAKIPQNQHLPGCPERMHRDHWGIFESIFFFVVWFNFTTVGYQMAKSGNLLLFCSEFPQDFWWKPFGEHCGGGMEASSIQKGGHYWFYLCSDGGKR